MADVITEGTDGLVATADGCRTAPLAVRDGGRTAADDGRVDDKVSIHEILEGMTNEFNKGMSPAKHPDNNADKTAAIAAEEATAPPSPSKVADEMSDGEKERDAAGEETPVAIAEEPQPPPTSEENHKGEEESPTAGKPQDASKKDNGIPRIVLTFRTIDENTDHGKKTKMSSCSSNLTLVPDELVNCDQIGGVSVKIENSDDNSDAVEESQAEEIKEAQPAREAEPKAVEDKVEDKTEKFNNAQSLEEKPEVAENNPESNNAVEVESVEQPEATPPVTRKRRTGRPRLRALRFLFFLSSL